MGLSIIEASQQYITKFNTLRMHLNISDHPIVRLINFGRDQIKKFITDSEVGIKQLLSFYDRQNQESEKAKLEFQENEKMLKRLIRDIKCFVELMHDTTVRFYQLDINTAIDAN